MLKQTAHNLNEVKALIKEAYARGNEDMYSEVVWLSHTGEQLCISRIGHVEFTLDLPDMSSVTIEVE